MSTVHTGMRMSTVLQTRITDAGEFSAVARALMLLGLAAAGDAMAAYRDEAREALAGVRDPRIADALGQLLFAGSTPVEPVLNRDADSWEVDAPHMSEGASDDTLTEADIFTAMGMEV